MRYKLEVTGTEDKYYKTIFNITIIKALKGDLIMSKEEKIKKPIYKRPWIWVLAVIVVLAIYGSNLEDKKDSATDPTLKVEDSNKEKDKKDETKKDEKKEESKINYENFLKIEMGQSYDDVVALLGEGTQKSSSEVAGIKTALYLWNGDGITSISATIQDGKIASKAQAGLSKEKVDLNLEKFETIKEGMTYDQVKEALGEGVLSTQSKVVNARHEIYTYSSKQSGLATISFIDGKLSSKTQVGLK